MLPQSAPTFDLKTFFTSNHGIVSAGLRASSSPEYNMYGAQYGPGTVLDEIERGKKKRRVCRES